jgi:hypothetical protein
MSREPSFSDGDRTGTWDLSKLEIQSSLQTYLFERIIRNWEAGTIMPMRTGQVTVFHYSQYRPVSRGIVLRIFSRCRVCLYRVTSAFGSRNRLRFCPFSASALLGLSPFRRWFFCHRHILEECVCTQSYEAGDMKKLQIYLRSVSVVYVE